MRSAFLYARVSSEDQVAKGNSIPFQVAAIEKYAAEHGYSIGPDDRFVDEAKSGEGMDRPGVNALRAAVKARKPAAILYLDETRWSRGYEGPLLRQRLRRSGVRCVAVQSGLGDTDDFHSVQLMEDVQGMGARELPAKLADMIPGRMRDAVERGGPPIGGKVPLGYVRQVTIVANKPVATLVPDPDTAPMIAQAFKLYADGASTRKVATFLNSHGSLKMLPANVRRLLLNPRYIGANVVGKRRVMKQEGVVTSNRADQSTWTVKPDQHEPIVDREVFDRVQQRLGKVTALNTRTREQSPMNPFPQGLVRCRKCGAGTVFKKNSKDGYVTYVLVCRRRQESNATDAAECSGSIAVDMLRNKVVAHLAMLLQGRKLRDAIIARKPQADPEIARLEAVLKAAIRKRDNLLVAIENADAGIASLAKKLSEREAEIVDTERRLRALRAVQPTAVNPATIETDAWSVKNALLKADYATVRPLIGKLFSEISVDFGAAAELRKAQRTLHAKFPTRTEAEVKAAKLRAAEIVDQIQWSLNGPVSFAYTWGGPVFSDTRNLLDFATELAEIAKVRPKDRVISGRKKARSS